MNAVFFFANDAHLVSFDVTTVIFEKREEKQKRIECLYVDLPKRFTTLNFFACDENKPNVFCVFAQYFVRFV